MSRIRLPFGVQDYLPDEYYNKKAVESGLESLFLSYGYAGVRPSAIEYLENFTAAEGADSHNKLFKFTDSDGSLLALRSDPTLQLARLVSSKIAPAEFNKLYYILDSYEYAPGETSTSRSREFAQAGIELYGDVGLSGDSEVAELAVSAFLKAGLKDFIIDLGRADFIEALLEEAGLPGSAREAFLAALSAKDGVGCAALLSGLNIPSAKKSLLSGLHTLYGGVEVLDKAERVCGGGKSAAAIAGLKQTYGALKNAGLGKYICIDLGMTRGQGYYTGIILRGFARGMGVPVLEGGRYDLLAASYGGGITAVGFSIGIKRLLVAMERAGLLKSAPKPYLAYYSECGVPAEVVSLRKSGKACDRFTGGGEAALKEYCRVKGIERAYINDKNGFRRVELDEK